MPEKYQSPKRRFERKVGMVILFLLAIELLVVSFQFFIAPAYNIPIKEVGIAFFIWHIMFFIGMLVSITIFIVGPNYWFMKQNPNITDSVPDNSIGKRNEDEDRNPEQQK